MKPTALILALLLCFCLCPTAARAECDSATPEPTPEPEIFTSGNYRYILLEDGTAHLLGVGRDAGGALGKRVWLTVSNTTGAQVK